MMIGAAFVGPRDIQDEVVEDNLPVKIDAGLSDDCDTTLRSQLRFQTDASTAERMRAVLRRIQLGGGVRQRCVESYHC